MRILLGVIAAAAAFWSVYWLIGSRSVEDGLRTWLAAPDKSGWVANYSSVETQGFPNRYDTTIRDIDLSVPAVRLTWSAPFLQLFQLTYRPNHVIAVWPNDQAFAVLDQHIAVKSSDARASMVFKPGTDFELDHSALVFEDIKLGLDAGWSGAIAKVLLATRTGQDGANAIDLGGEVFDLRLSGPELVQSGLLPDLLEHLKLDATLQFDAPLDRAAIDARWPAVSAIDLHLLQGQWGEIGFSAKGDLTLDLQGRINGSVRLQSSNWRKIVKIAVATEWASPALDAEFDQIAEFTEAAETSEVTLEISGGTVLLGPFNLGTLPRLVGR